MAPLTADNVQRARDLMALYPQARSALIPILHVLQEQDGYLTDDGMQHVAELLGLTPAEVYGTASFYDMLFTEPVGRHLIAICTNIACLLAGGYELLEHAEETLGIKAGATTGDGEFTLEEVECIALCGNAPCLTVNWRYFGDMTPNGFDTLVTDLRAGRLREEVPPHGTLCRVRRSVGLMADGDGGQRPSSGTAGEMPASSVQTERGETQPAGARATEASAAQAAKTEKPGGADTTPRQEGSRPQQAGGAS